MFHNYETEKITRKASDAAEYNELFGSSARDRHATRYNCRFTAASLALRVIVVRQYMRRA